MHGHYDRLFDLLVEAGVIDPASGERIDCDVQVLAGIWLPERKLVKIDRPDWDRPDNR